MNPGVHYRVVGSPVGDLLLAGQEGVLSILNFWHGAHPVRLDPEWSREDSAFPEVVGQLDAYFSGKLRRFDIPLAPQGTPFQQDVWGALRRIPYGETRTYGEIARSVGKPTAFRAVGAANGQNPIAIIIPCHRVVGSNGSLTGFGGGLEVKHRLLALEGATLL